MNKRNSVVDENASDGWSGDAVAVDYQLAKQLELALDRIAWMTNTLADSPISLQVHLNAFANSWNKDKLAYLGFAKSEKDISLLYPLSPLK